MKRFHAFILTTVLIFSCTACSATQNSPIGTSTIGNSPIEVPHEAGSGNTAIAAEDINPQKINETAQIGFEVSFIEENGNYTADELINGDGNFGGWEFCLMTAENCLSASGIYTSVNEALDMARDLIREIPDDYVNYQSLKDYYTKVAAYAAYFENVSGSYNDLIEAITAYENDIQAAKEPLLFDFG